MGVKRLILRFRDFFPGVETVPAHAALLEENGVVLWGWWKKEHEPDQAPDLLDIDFSPPIPVLLVNRFDKTAYETHCIDVLRGVGRNMDHVPPYYRSQAGSVHVWLKFTGAIEQVPYDEEIAEGLGEHTLYIERDTPIQEASNYVIVTEAEIKTSGDAVAERPDAAKSRELPCAIRMIHISDLHFNPDDHNFAFPGVRGVEAAQVSLAEAVHADYGKNYGTPVDVLLISGDVTSKADWEEPLLGNIVKELKKLSVRLGVELSNVVVCPGNHDFKRPEPGKMADAAKLSLKDATSFAHERDFRFFRNQLLGIAVDEPLATVLIRECQDFVLKLGVLNSANLAATQFVEYGFVGDHLNGVLNEMRAGTKKAYKALVLHHHLIPISPIEEPKSNGVSVTLDSHSILSRAQQEGVQLVLHGHQHIPKIVKTAQAWQYRGKWQGLEDDIFILASGSAGSKWLGGGVANTYSIIDFTPEHVSISCRRLDRFGGVGSEEFAVTLGIRPR